MKYLLASNCFITKGKLRSLLIDVQRYNQYLISDELSNILSKRVINRKNVPPKYDKIIDTLIQEDILLALDNDDIDLFPKLDTSFDVPSFINDAIIDVDNHIHDFKKIFNELYNMLCRHIEIRFFSDVEISTIQNIFKEIENSILEAVDIYIPYTSFLMHKKSILNIIEKNIRLRLLYVHSCPQDIQIENKDRILFSSQKMNSEKHCGIISKFFFTVNSLTYFESQTHNTCLNRKISIDVNGEIKNCPSMSKSYGNIKDTTLQQALNKKGFKDLWDLNKDKISGCKDCEFRHICTDCRAYIENPEDIYSKPLKCGYNPYTAEWEEWSTNPLKQKAIKYYGMKELVR